MTKPDPLSDLKRRADAVGYRKLADVLGFAASYLNDVAHGRRPMSDKLAAALGYEKVTSYKKKS
jgi:hypothetical protein